MNAPYLILGLLCGLAIGHALNWATRTPRSRTDRHEARDCEGTSPCSTCQDKRECGRSGCVRAALGAGGLGDGAERRVEAAIEKLQRCSLGCWPFGQCKAAMHGTPSECAAGVAIPADTEFSDAKRTIMEVLSEQEVRALAIAQFIQLRFHEKYGNAMNNACDALKAEQAHDLGVKTPDGAQP